MNKLFANGVYRGITWSDDAPQVMCELEVTIDNLLVALRIATGTRIICPLAVPLTQVSDLTSAEIAACYQEGADLSGIVGIELGDTGIRLLLLREPTDEELSAGLEPGEEPVAADDVARIVVLGLPGEEAFGHSVLFTPEQVQAPSFGPWLTPSKGSGRTPSRSSLRAACPPDSIRPTSAWRWWDSFLYERR